MSGANDLSRGRAQGHWRQIDIRKRSFIVWDDGARFINHSF